MSEYIVRKTDKFDLILSLNRKIFPCDDLEICDNTVGWIIWHNKTPVGFCTMRMLTHRIAYMDRAGILEEHRGKGLHKKLLRVRESYARRQNYKEIITYTVSDNFDSLFTLVRHGYKKYDPEYAYAGRTCHYVIKDL